MGGFHFNPLKGITRALNIPDKARPGIQTGLSVVFPVVAVGNILASKALEKGFDLFSKSGRPAAPRTFESVGQNPLNFTYQAPSYQAPYYGTYGGNTQLDYSYGGQPSWDSSTTFSTPPQTQSPVYSPPVAAGRSWEDLVGLALPFFL